MADQQILIVGCGDIGSRTAVGLVAKGYQVFGARRSVAALPDGVQALRLDVSDLNSWFDLTLQPDYIIYSVAAGGFTEASYQAAYADGVRNMLTWLTEQRIQPKRIFFVSSTSVYGQNEGETVDENTPTQPQGFAGRIMLEAEEALRNSVFSHTVLRFSGIYGPGRDLLIRQVKQGRIAPEVPVMYSNRIHSEDCAGVINHLLVMDHAEEAIDSLYLATDKGSVPIYEVMRWMADELEVTPTEIVEAPTKRRASKCCLNQRLLATGYIFQYPTYREGYAPALAAIKAQS